MAEKENWGFAIKKLRIEKGLTQTKLAELCGLTRSIISRIELGHVKTTNQYTFANLAKGLGMTLDDLQEAITGKRLKSQSELPEQILERYRLVQPVSVPVYTDFPSHFNESTAPIDYIYLARTKTVRKTIEAYIAHGNCMNPQINDGDVVIVDREAAIDEGDIVICLIGDNIHTGKLRKIADELYLENNNGRYKFSECKVAAPVIEIIRKLK
jgi:transcriptional regulator with XRE-family HTH domain